MFKDPLESELQKKDIWLLPAECTLIEPPEAKEGFLIVWSGEAWEYKEREKPKEEEPYIPTEDDLKAQVRAVRNRFLEQTDKFLLSDYPITSTQKAKYKQYRVYLRDYPDSSEDWFEHEPMSFDEWCYS